MQFPLINLIAATDPIPVDTFDVLIGEDEVTKIRKHLAYEWNEGVTLVESCWDGQVRRRYYVEKGKITRGVFYSRIDYTCQDPKPLRIPPEPVAS